MAWLEVVGAVAAPLTVAVIYARQARRQQNTVPNGLPPSFGTVTRPHVLHPARWFHYMNIIAFLAMPIVQYFGYMAHHHWIWVIAPIALVMLITIVINVVSPRTVFEDEGTTPHSIQPLLVTTAGLAVALALPTTGTILILQGVLIDIVGFILVGHAIRMARRARSRGAIGC